MPPRSITPRGAGIVGFLWGFAEATFFFVVPDVWVGYAASLSPFSGMVAALAAIAGAVAGGAALFALTELVLHGDVVRWMLYVPAIRPPMFTIVSDQVDRAGVTSLLLAPFQGIPYKVYTAVLVLRGTGLATLLLWTVPSRAVRLIPVAVLASAVRYPLRDRIARHARLWAVTYVAAWALFYAWYWTHLP